MTMWFTEEEEKYIVKELFNWHIAEDCPERIRGTLEKKFAEMKAFEDRDKKGQPKHEH